ncbi:MAG: hypothetical protein IPG79_11340 [Saprospiraceae bacterium]|nr:hypothetical protein [Saprospiraceae bacterium]
MTEHNKYVFQSTANVYLQAGQYYYIEINQKQGTGSSHFGLFWQTPFTPPNVWKRIPSYYFYDYNCDVACIPQAHHVMMEILLPMPISTTKIVNVWEHLVPETIVIVLWPVIFPLLLVG